MALNGYLLPISSEFSHPDFEDGWEKISQHSLDCWTIEVSRHRSGAHFVIGRQEWTDYSSEDCVGALVLPGQRVAAVLDIIREAIGACQPE